MDSAQAIGTGGRPAGGDRLSPQRELQLVEAHRRGDPDAIGTLLRSYQKRIYSICYRMVRNPDEARDLAQDAMVKILEGLESYDGRAQVSTWIIRVTMNCCLSHLRKQRLRRHASLDGSPQGESWAPRSELAGREELSPPARVQQAQLQAALLRALGGLDPQMRALIVLRDLQGLEYQHIAEALDVPVGTVKSRLFRARTALREAVERQVGAPSADEETR